MSAQYKENNFSTKSLSSSYISNQNDEKLITKPNIDHLIKRILDERKRERKNTIFTLIAVFSSIILIVYFFSN
jgi:hypothetical protein